MRNKNTSHMKHVMILISNQEECEHLGLLGPLKRLIAWKCVRYVMYQDLLIFRYVSKSCMPP